MDSTEVRWEHFDPQIDEGDEPFVRQVFRGAFGRVSKWDLSASPKRPDGAYGRVYVYCVRCDRGVVVTDEKTTVAKNERRCCGVYFLTTVCGTCERRRVVRGFEAEVMHCRPAEGTELSWNMLECWKPFVDAAGTTSRLGAVLKLSKRVVQREVVFAMGGVLSGLRVSSVRTQERSSGYRETEALGFVDLGWL